jgi:2-polyprenyl-6-hydroxyphenyl methylase/3-demethylubiquinone-9 3-methyltransferase
MTTQIQEQLGDHAREVRSGERFEFGANWTRFLSNLDDDRIREAEISLRQMLHVEDLKGMTFLDIGCGSGLFSLAAYRLGACIRSFDFDPKSVNCARELRRRFAADDPAWVIEQGSVLDQNYLESLGSYDVVYSWGVLHHTGSMWQALDNAGQRVKPAGLLFIAIYNDQGTRSRRWLSVKRLYNKLPSALRPIVVIPTLVMTWGPRWIKDMITLRPFKQWREYGGNRGMSPWYDHIDWVGGYPFEVAKPEQIFHFYRERGYSLTNLVTEGGTVGCNQFVFRKDQ